MPGPSGGFHRRRRGEMALKISPLVVALLLAVFVEIGSAQLLADNTESFCVMASCLGWCGCSGKEFNFADFRNTFIFSGCAHIKTLNVYDSCTNNPDTAFIAREESRSGNVRDCTWTRLNPLILFQNATDADGAYAVRVWEGVDPANYQLLDQLCAPQCYTECGIMPPTSPTPSTEAVITRKIDDMIPRFNTTLAPTGTTGGLTPEQLRIIGIAVGAFFVGLLLCLIVVFIYCCRKRKKKGPKLPPRRYVNQNGNADNRDYATIEELNLTPVQSPRRTGGAFNNLLYRSESLSALTTQYPDPSMTRSMSDLALLGDPPHPPVQRNKSLLPGIDPAVADRVDGRTAPIGEDGYTKYLHEEETPSLPYMHLKVTPSLSDPSGNGRRKRPPRYRSNTADATHADATEVEVMLNRIRAKETLKDSSNRRFVPNQCGRARSSTLGEEYNRLRRGQKPVPRSKKAAEAGGFTSVPVHGQYHSRPRKSSESIRKWRSLPDMTDGGSPSPSGSVRRQEGYQEPPMYHLLEQSPVSSTEDFSNRDTRLMTDIQNGYIHPLPDPVESNQNGSTHSSLKHAPGESDTLSDRYDPVYEPGRVCNGHSGNYGDYQPLAASNSGHGSVDSEDEAYQGAEVLLDKDAYLKPKRTMKPTPRNNGRLSSDGQEPMSPTSSVSSGGNLSSRSNSRNKPHNNNNLFPRKSSPSRTVGGSVYSPLKQDARDTAFDFDDDMENGEYMYHPGEPCMQTAV